MDATTCVAQIEGVPEEGSAGGFFEAVAGPSEEDAVGVRGWGLRVGENEYVGGFDTFFLDARGGDVDDIAASSVDKGKVGR
jgi:hypothetical protein